MRLKVLTTALVIFGVILMLCWPLIVGERPPADAGTKILAAFGQRMMIYFLITVGVWMSVAVLAVVIARQTRDQFLAEERENLNKLIEGTLHDHNKRS